MMHTLVRSFAIAASAIALTSNVSPAVPGSVGGTSVVPGTVSMRAVTGTWQLTLAEAKDAKGVSRTAPYGPDGLGLMSLYADGRVVAILWDGKPAGSGKFNAFAGRYRIDADHLVIRIEQSQGQWRIGTDHIRTVKMEGREKLILIPDPATVNGVIEYQRAVWTRVGRANPTSG